LVLPLNVSGGGGGASAWRSFGIAHEGKIKITLQTSVRAKIRVAPRAFEMAWEYVISVVLDGENGGIFVRAGRSLKDGSPSSKLEAIAPVFLSTELAAGLYQLCRQAHSISRKSGKKTQEP